MKVVNIAGGLGNQMFQYAFAVALQERYPAERVLIDTHHYHTLFFKRVGSVNLHNGYELGTLFEHATLPVASWREISRVSRYIPNYVLSRLARKLLPRRRTEYVAPYSENFCLPADVFTDGDRYYEGYWQCARYYEPIRDRLRQVYAHPTPNAYNAEMIDRIGDGHSVGIHVRRGDYLKAPEFNGICTLDYYRKAIEAVKADGRKHTYYIFSNDTAWCQAHLSPLLEGESVCLVTGNTGKQSCWDMFLMTYCQDLIIANSSFSWWGAFLNSRNGRVYAPDPWIRRDCRREIHVEGWTLIPQPHP